MPIAMKRVFREIALVLVNRNVNNVPMVYMAETMLGE
jgi:hypothetical protein